MILMPNALNYSKRNNTISPSALHVYVYLINLNTLRHCNPHSNSQCSNKVSAHQQQHLTSAFHCALGTKNVVLRKTYSLLIASRQWHLSSANVPSAQTMLSFEKQIHYCLPFSNNTYKVEFTVSSALTMLSLAKHKRVLIAYRQRHNIYTCNSSCPRR